MSKCPSCESKEELVKMREIGNAFKWDNNLQEGFKKLIELIVETMMAHINVSHPCTCDNKPYTGFDLAEEGDND